MTPLLCIKRSWRWRMNGWMVLWWRCWKTTNLMMRFHFHRRMSSAVVANEITDTVLSRLQSAIWLQRGDDNGAVVKYTGCKSTKSSWNPWKVRNTFYKESSKINSKIFTFHPEAYWWSPCMMNCRQFHHIYLRECNWSTIIKKHHPFWNKFPSRNFSFLGGGGGSGVNCQVVCIWNKLWAYTEIVSCL